jgi:hypothetical protein
LPQISTATIRQVLKEAGLTWRKQRSWCETGTAQRRRRRAGRAVECAANRATWARGQEGLSVRFTLLDDLPPLRLLLILDNLAGHKSVAFVRWLMAHGIMPLYTPISANMRCGLKGLAQGNRAMCFSKYLSMSCKTPAGCVDQSIFS